jgi:hypothetical protein
MCRRFETQCSIFIGSLKQEEHEVGTECSKTSARKIQSPGDHPKERIQNSDHGENLLCFVCRKFRSQMFKELKRLIILKLLYIYIYF